MLYLEITEVAFIHGNVANNIYQINSSVLYTFVRNKSFGQLLDVSPKNVLPLKTFESKFSHVKVWFTQKVLILWI